MLSAEKLEQAQKRMRDKMRRGFIDRPQTKKPEPHDGAVDVFDCPSGGKCKCGKCMVCGFHKHTAIHGPVNGGGPGSKPYGHAFRPIIRLSLQEAAQIRPDLRDMLITEAELVTEGTPFKRYMCPRCGTVGVLPVDSKAFMCWECRSDQQRLVIARVEVRQ
jgi:hypothetical protein